MNMQGGLLICVVQVTLVAAAGLLASLALGRRRGGAAASSSAASLAAAVALTAFAFSPWPSWLQPPKPSALQPTAFEAAVDSTAGGSAVESVKVAPLDWEPAALASAPSTPIVSPFPPVADSVPIDTKTSAVGPSIVQIPGVLFTGGLIIGLLRWVGGLWSVRALARASRPIDDLRLKEQVEQVRRELRCRRAVEVRECTRTSTAAVVGWRRPVVLLSGDWSTWTDGQRRGVLAHEIAHVVRGDGLTAAVARLAVVLHFYHPLVHWLADRLRLEQELAADALAASIVG
ncbi:MAG: M56 family metallopeptidase, partial [Planctomycetia bacterium]